MGVLRRRSLLLGVAATALLAVAPSPASAAPETTIDSGPSGQVTLAVFFFSSDVRGSKFECNINSRAWTPCSSPYGAEVPRPDSYTFKVRAIDRAGKRDPTPASQRFVVHSVEFPTVEISRGPIGVTNDSTPTFDFSSNDPDAHFSCELNLIGPPPFPGSCDSPKTFHIFEPFNVLEVSAVNRAGIGGFSVVRAFTFDPNFDPDVNPPDTEMLGGASFPITPRSSHTTHDPTPSFSFASSKTGSMFECSLDGAAYSACRSPLTTRHLDDGFHNLSVRSIDPQGRVDPSPTGERFRVLTAEVRVSGSTLVVDSPLRRTPPGFSPPPAPTDNIRIARPSNSTLRVTDLPKGWHTGSGVHVGRGCTRSGDYTANCNAERIEFIKIFSADGNDKVLNATGIESWIKGGRGNDNLKGGASADHMIADGGVDILRGKGGDDRLIARAFDSDWTVDCDGDGASNPGARDKAVLDLPPNDPSYIVTNCEQQERR